VSEEDGVISEGGEGLRLEFDEFIQFLVVLMSNGIYEFGGFLRQGWWDCP
jgi:hypothetical protein